MDCRNKSLSNMVNKHVKKRFLRQGETIILKPNSKVHEFDLTKDNQLLFSQIGNDAVIILESNQTGENIFAFLYKKNDKKYLVPIPDFTLCNLNFAYFMMNETVKLRSELFKKLSKVVEDDVYLEELFLFYGYSSSYLIQLYSALESFVNVLIVELKRTPLIKQSLPNDKDLEKMNLFDKIKKIDNTYYGIGFFKKDSKTSAIHNLKKLRNDIVHVKYDTNLSMPSSIVNRLLNFKYEEAYNAVVDLMNYYKPNYVEPCDCGRDF